MKKEKCKACDQFTVVHLGKVLRYGSYFILFLMLVPFLWILAIFFVPVALIGILLSYTPIFNKTMCTNPQCKVVHDITAADKINSLGKN